jgi:hypothetical protein
VSIHYLILFTLSLTDMTAQSPDHHVALYCTRVVASTSHTDVVDVSTEELATTVNLGDLENPIELRVLSQLDFEHILEVCPVLN